MFKRLLFGALLIGLLAVFFKQDNEPQPRQYVQGKNKTALFLVNKEHGLSNVHVATASALLENYPDIQVHFASFSPLGDKLVRISRFARRKTPTAHDVIFHELRAPSYLAAVKARGKDVDTMIHPPGSAGIGHFLKDLQLWITPWSAEEHFAIYSELNGIIEKVDPAVVVLDWLFLPAMDAARDKNRLHAIISPNTLVDTFLPQQPYGSMFWKYPAMASGHAFPVPLRKIPENIYFNLRFIYTALTTPDLSAKKKALKEMGLQDSINFLNIHRHDAPWISMTTEGASIPVDVVPLNVTCAEPIVLSAAPAAEQDPKLAEWLKKAPTVLVNLGSLVQYSERQATTMAKAIAGVLSKSNVQFLWKFNKFGDYSDDFTNPLQPYLDNGRLRMHKWLTVDPSSLLESGHIVASVHHGGSNCYHEAIGAGVPQVILPLWTDLYNYAALVETINVGVWGCRETSPDWTVEGLSQAFLKVVDGGEASVFMRRKAKELGDRINAGEKGRDIAAREVAKLAYAGRS